MKEHSMFNAVCSVDLIFFFKQKTAYEMRISDWSSDVFSSDLRQHQFAELLASRAPSLHVSGQRHRTLCLIFAQAFLTDEFGKRFVESRVVPDVQLLMREFVEQRRQQGDRKSVV